MAKSRKEILASLGLMDPRAFYLQSAQENPMHPRASGRTTAMLVEALEAAQYQPVHLYAHTHWYARVLKRELLAMAYEAGIRVEARDIEIAAMPGRRDARLAQALGTREKAVACDHHVLEAWIDESRANDRSAAAFDRRAPGPADVSRNRRQT